MLYIQLELTTNTNLRAEKRARRVDVTLACLLLLAFVEAMTIEREFGREKFFRAGVAKTDATE